jgi:protein SCO1/2
MMRRRLAPLACALSLLGSGPAAWAELPAQVPIRHGEEPLPGLGGALDLTDHKGRPFSLAQTKGAPTLLFFGFTQCGNTCPVALAQIKQVLAAFQSRKPPMVLVVTLDPLTDTPSVLASHLGHVDDRIIGLTGTPQQIEQAARRYGVATQTGATNPAQGRRPDKAAPLAHSSRWYLLNGNHQIERVYKITTPVTDIVQDIQQMQQQHEPVWSKAK